MNMINLLEETLEVLEINGRTEEDVLWVGRDYIEFLKPSGERITYKSTWKDFCAKADFEYDRYYGSIEIPMDLIVVGKDFWLERHEYDGSEWWEFRTAPIEPEETRELDLRKH